MPQPINNHSPSKCLTGPVKTILKELEKAYSDCPEYCLKKCQRAWEKGKLGQPCTSDSAYVQSCIKECRQFQNLSPLID